MPLHVSVSRAFPSSDILHGDVTHTTSPPPACPDTKNRRPLPMRDLLQVRHYYVLAKNNFCFLPYILITPGERRPALPATPHPRRARSHRLTARLGRQAG